jgi:HSP90 family molecular chaperone
MSEEIKNTEKGGISVEIEHIFPIIKKWLYSEKEIFLREIVSNACDAVTKLKRLSSLGEAQIDDENYKITVKLDKDWIRYVHFRCDAGSDFGEVIFVADEKK